MSDEKILPIPPGNRFRGLQGGGRQPSGFGLGPEGSCICPKCGEKKPHKRGIPCYSLKCPSCGSSMVRGR